MTEKGVSAALASDSDPVVQKGIIEGKYQLLFISPEKLLIDLGWRENLRSSVYRTHLVGFAVDEAHCVTKW